MSKNDDEAKNASRPPAHGVARGSLPKVASEVRVAGAAEAIERRGTRARPDEACEAGEDEWRIAAD